MLCERGLGYSYPVVAAPQTGLANVARAARCVHAVGGSGFFGFSAGWRDRGPLRFGVRLLGAPRLQRCQSG